MALLESMLNVCVCVPDGRLTGMGPMPRLLYVKLVCVGSNRTTANCATLDTAYVVGLIVNTSEDDTSTMSASLLTA